MMTTNQPVGGFDNLSALHDLVRGYRWGDEPHMLQHFICYGLEHHPLTTFAFNINASAMTTLNDVRINLRALVHPDLDVDLKFPGKTKLRFALSCPAGEGTYKEDASICFSDLKIGLILLF
jgi:hypothetical protein